MALTAIAFNLADLVTSYIAFMNYGLAELNAYATLLHLNNYLASLMAFTTYQAIIAITYLITRKYPPAMAVLAVFTAMKAVVVMGNILSCMGIQNINYAIASISYSISTLNTNLAFHIMRN